MIEKKVLSAAFDKIDRPWTPVVAADINDMQVKLAKFEGAFDWHSHEVEDEMFLVVTGRLRMELRGQDPVVVEPGEFVVVPHGVEHRPVAEVPSDILLLEPNTTLNTGTEETDRTVRNLQRI